MSSQIFQILSNLSFLAQQRQVDAPLKIKFAREEYTVGTFMCARYPPDRWRGAGVEAPKFKHFGICVCPVGLQQLSDAYNF